MLLAPVALGLKGFLRPWASRARPHSRAVASPQRHLYLCRLGPRVGLLFWPAMIILMLTLEIHFFAHVGSFSYYVEAHKYRKWDAVGVHFFRKKHMQILKTT